MHTAKTLEAYFSHFFFTFNQDKHQHDEGGWNVEAKQILSISISQRRNLRFKVAVVRLSGDSDELLGLPKTIARE